MTPELVDDPGDVIDGKLTRRKLLALRDTVEAMIALGARQRQEALDELERREKARRAMHER